MSTLFHPHVTCVWGDILIGLGTGVRTFKLSCEAFQTVGECPIIFIMSVTPGSPLRPLDSSSAQFLLSFLGPRDLGALTLFIALSF